MFCITTASLQKRNNVKSLSFGMVQMILRRSRKMWGWSKIWQAGDKQDWQQHRSSEATGACRSSTDCENDFWGAFHWQRHSVENPYWKLGNAQVVCENGSKNSLQIPKTTKIHCLPRHYQASEGWTRLAQLCHNWGWNMGI